MGTSTDGVGPETTGSRPGLRRGRYAMRAVILGLLLAQLVTSQQQGYSLLADGILGNLVMGLSGLTCLGRAVLVRRRRVPFLLLGLTGCSWTAGNLVHVFHDRTLDPVPHPSLADIGFLSA